MKVFKFLATVTFITYFSLLYVYQQTEIFRLGYAGQERHVKVEELLDRNALLRYNIARQASLVQIGERMSELADFQMPDSCRLVRLAPALREGEIFEQGPARQETLLSRIFGIKRQAEANTLNPR
ncbi:MAG: hypothetical protein AMJ95_06415 [Omnitrophica WOR_2 bacterium SM23_72]|nr:MAG: hypothetical protein AMJ95_06415 [Omnitrophica WOR_2 bacterium SM23_72]